MKLNVGTADQVIRIIAGIIVGAAAFLWAKGTLKIILIIVGAIFLLTGLIRFCPLYVLLGLNTRKHKES